MNYVLKKSNAEVAVVLNRRVLKPLKLTSFITRLRQNLHILYKLSKIENFS